MTKAENFIRKGKCSKNHCSSMSNQAWTDLNSQGNILKLHDKCPNPKCGCKKIISPLLLTQSDLDNIFITFH